jgi:hypothetical protein
VKEKDSGSCWELVNVYSSVEDNRKSLFLQELYSVVEEGLDAIMIGGDFNLIRSREEKSSGNVAVRWMNSFNNFIAKDELRELH